MPDFLLDENGLQTPRLLPDVRARVVEVWRSKFGANAQTASDSPDGLIIDTLSLLLLQHWEAVTDVYQDGFFRTARMTSLALLLDLFGKVALGAEAATVELVWYGTNGTAVLDGSIANTSSEDRFANDADVTIGETCWVVRVDTVANVTNYSITIDAVVAGPYLSDGSATAAEIVAGLVAALLADGHTAFSGGTDPSGLGLVVIDATPAAPPTSTANMTVFRAVRGPATATAEGVVVALAGTINEVATPIVGVEGVTSTADAAGGREVETASEYRVRHLATLNSGGNASVEAIRSHLLELTDVEQVTILRNRGDVVDANGLPPHSVEALVLGGDDDEIAAELFASVSAGDQTYGSTTVNVVDSEGFSEPISFSRPTSLYLHLEISVTDGEGYPATGTPLETILEAVIAYLTADDTAPEMGEDFYRFQLGVPIGQAVPGIASVAVRTATTAAPGDPPTFAASDIVVTSRQILVPDSSRISMIQL